MKLLHGRRGRLLFQTLLLAGVALLWSCSSSSSPGDGEPGAGSNNGAANNGAANNGGGGSNDLYDDTPFCNYRDNPEDCDGWNCYREGNRTVCEQSRPDRPDGGGDWECSDDAQPGYTTCVSEDEPGGGGGNWDCSNDAQGNRVCVSDDPSGGGGNWDCEYVDGGEDCTRRDGPDGNPGWDCVDDATGTTCTSTDPELREDEPQGGGWDCVTNGDTRQCHDDHDDDSPGSSRDNPDGGSGWDCYNDATGRHCHRDDPGGGGTPDEEGRYDTPDGGDGWDCVTEQGARTCTEEEGGDDPGGGGDGWDCTYDDATGRTTCVSDPDEPTEDDTWECYETEDRRICESEDPDVPDGPQVTDCGDPAGNINGRVCAPSGDFWVVGANVTVRYTDCNGQEVVITTQTDAEGYFILVGVPEGEHTVRVEKGPYSAEYTVTVTAGETATIPLGDFCFDQSTNIAVITGEYDKVELVLDSLGFTYDLFGGWPNNDEARALLGDLGRMNDYDVIFMNCGTTLLGIMDDPRVLNAVRSNIESYVSSGGRLYVSDWDWLFLEEPFPDQLDFFGEDRAQLDVLQGASGYRPAVVRDPELVALLGEDRVTIQFDYPEWAVVEAAGPDVRVILSADVERTRGGLLRDVPVLMAFPYGEGEVIYTSYHVHQNQAINTIFAYAVLGFQ